MGQPDTANDRAIVLIGGGGHCRSVLDTIQRSLEFSKIYITDPAIPAGSAAYGAEAAGTDDSLSSLYVRGVREAFITVGSIKNTLIRRNAFRKAERIGFLFPALIDRSAVVSSSSHIGKGTFIGKGVIVNMGAAISGFAILNTGSIIEHDCKIGSFAHVAVGAVVCGGCEIGDDVLVGANATVIQGVKVGKNAVIGAGSVVLKDVPENTTVTGIWG